MTITALQNSEWQFSRNVTRKIAQNTVKLYDDGFGSVVASHCDGDDSSLVVTTLGALSETVATVSLRTVPRLFTCQSCILILVNN